MKRGTERINTNNQLERLEKNERPDKKACRLFVVEFLFKEKGLHGARGKRKHKNNKKRAGMRGETTKIDYCSHN